MERLGETCSSESFEVCMGSTNNEHSNKVVQKVYDEVEWLHIAEEVELN